MTFDKCDDSDDGNRRLMRRSWEGLGLAWGYTIGAHGPHTREVHLLIRFRGPSPILIFRSAHSTITGKSYIALR